MRTSVRTNTSVSKKSNPFVLTTLLTVFLLAFSACSAPSTTETGSDTGTSDAGLIHITVGASPVPHADILNYVQENLAAAAGIEIEIVEFTDYVQPNLALADGEIDANFFQHVPYLTDFNTEHGTDLVSVAAVHIEPLGIYSNTLTSLDELSDGAVVGIPNDATNAGRALNLLAANGLITLADGVGYAATVADITANPRNLEIVELEAAQLVRSLEDTAISVINGNYALEGGLTPATDALALESGENNPYANVLVVAAGHENDEGIQILIQLLNSAEVRQYIEDNYNGSVIPAF
ncbi:MAG TPA: MetQ/NlpA family ABC transporter substrate-binding protein [Longilinea sp.]|nr:MetQ/NlpA family ABC transporter substrate-binding protein [Longilinea sp.]